MFKEYFTNTYQTLVTINLKWIILYGLYELFMLYDSNKVFKNIIQIRNIHFNIVSAINFVEKGDL